MQESKNNFRKSQISYTLWRGQSLTRAQIAKTIQLNLPATSILVQEMIDSGELIEEGRAKSTGGRKAHIISLNPDRGRVISVNFSLSSISSCIADFRCNILEEDKINFSLDEGKDTLLKKILDSIEKWVEFSKKARLPVLHIGVSISGLVDRERGISISFPRFGDWNDVPLKRIIEKKFGIETSLVNHIVATNLAERIFGKYREYRNTLYFHLGSGFGVGIKINGEAYDGTLCTVGEFGHTTAVENGPICYCGNYGCLESIASDYALVNTVKQMGEEKVDSKIFQLIRNGEQITLKMIFEVSSEDRLAANILENAGEHIGIGMANLINVLAPEAIILGGTMAIPESKLIKSVLKTLHSRILPRLDKDLKIHFSSFEEQAGIKGAVTYAIEKYFLSLL